MVLKLTAQHLCRDRCAEESRAQYRHATSDAVAKTLTEINQENERFALHTASKRASNPHHRESKRERERERERERRKKGKEREGERQKTERKRERERARACERERARERERERERERGFIRKQSSMSMMGASDAGPYSEPRKVVLGLLEWSVRKREGPVKSVTEGAGWVR